MLSRLGRASKYNQLKRTFSTKVELPPLPYELSGLEPVISGHLMEFHYGKHHQTYVNNLNNLTEQSAEALAKGDMAKHVALCNAVKFNAGGHLNHTFFWESLAPTSNGGGALPDANSPLGQALQQSFGGTDKFIDLFNAQTAAIQGSGWGWLLYDTQAKSLRYQALPN